MSTYRVSVQTATDRTATTYLSRRKALRAEARALSLPTTVSCCLSKQA